MNGQPFTDSEDQEILGTSEPLGVLARRLGRSESSVASRRSRLRRERRQPGRDVNGVMNIPRGQGHRLIAKTCLHCEELLPASAFKRRSDGGRESYCIPCRSVRAIERRSEQPEQWDAAVHARQREEQRRALASARNARKEWTGPEIELVMRDDLTDRQKAEMLGRSFYAVRHIIRKIRAGDPIKVELAGLPRA